MVRKFSIFIFVLFELLAIFLMVRTGDLGYLVPMVIGIVMLLALWTDTLHLIPGDTATEMYRMRMLFEEQLDNRNKRRERRSSRGRFSHPR